MLWEVVHVYTICNHKYIHVTTTFMTAPRYDVHKLHKKVKNKSFRDGLSYSTSQKAKKQGEKPLPLQPLHFSSLGLKLLISAILSRYVTLPINEPSITFLGE